MLIILYGPDSYRRLQKLNRYIEAHREKNPNSAILKFNLGGFLLSGNGKEEFLKLQEFVRNRSIFAVKNLAILENVWSFESRLREKRESEVLTDSVIKNFKKFLEPHLGSDDLKIIISESVAPPTKLKTFFEKADIKEEFEELTGAGLKTFIRQEAQSRGISFTPAALSFLTEEFRGNTWRLITELEKIRWLKTGRGAAIDVEDVYRVGDYVEPENLFAFINTFNYEGGIAKKIVGLERLLYVREEPAKIFNFLASRNFSPEFLEKMADYDVAVKSGKMDYEEVLLDLVLE